MKSKYFSIHIKFHSLLLILFVVEFLKTPPDICSLQKEENMKLSIILIFAIHFFEKCSTLPNPQNTFHFECQNDCSNDNFGNTNTNNYYGSSEHVKKNNKEAGAGKELKGAEGDQWAQGSSGELKAP